MNNLELLLKLINEKRAHLITYETFSTSIIHSDLDDINEMLNQRELMIHSIDKLDQLIKEESEHSDEKELINAIFQHRTHISELPNEYRSIFEGVESIMDSLENIKVLDNLIFTRILHLKEEIELNIKQTNNVSKIQKYFDTYETELDFMNDLASLSKKV
jgi:DNA-binding ferritin-like protein (Dps family)